jgi:hypothetical protein
LLGVAGILCLALRRRGSHAPLPAARGRD